MGRAITVLGLTLALILGGVRAASAADPLPIVARSLLLTTAAPEQSFDIDLGTLPARPRLVVTATPNPPQPDLRLQIEATNWTLHGGYVFGCAASIFSNSVPGPATLEIDLFPCGNGPAAFQTIPSPTATIRIRVVDFGSSTALVNVLVDVRGETRPATAEVVERVAPANTPQTVTFVASRDTVLYEDQPAKDNGAGQFLWVGRNYVGDFEPMTRSNGWADTPFGTSTAAASVVDGIVYLQGAVRGGAIDVIGTLPPEAHPESPVLVAVDLCNAAKGRLVIYPDGEIRVLAASSFSNATCFTSLEGVSFAPFATGFSPLTLLNGWLNALATSGSAGVALINGIVHFRGGIWQGSSAHMFNLPIGMHPATDVYVGVTLCGGSKGRLIIRPSGEVSVQAEDTFSTAQCYTALDGASFALNASGFTPISLTNGWIPYQLGTSSPAAKVVRGLVHLKGAMQNGTSGFAFVLPPGMRPATNVYVPVDLCSARKGRLFIQPSGSVSVEVESGVFSTAQCFTSLDGVTFAPSMSSFESARRHSLLAFDLRSELSPNATVNDATLRFTVTDVKGAGLPYPLRVFRVAPDAFDPLAIWEPGISNAAGTEFDVPLLAETGASWSTRVQPFGFWTNAGGDTVGPELASASVASPGELLISSASLRGTVQNMVATDGGPNGFLLTASAPLSLSRDEGVQTASRQNPDAASHPRLIVDYVSPEVYEAGETPIGTISFIDAASNLRWIYDTDQDGIFATPVGGACELQPLDPGNPNVLPYTYGFTGAPGFTGVDCCTWRVSSSTGVVGTGQALFFHNLDPATNMPLDTDLDGIKDGCDNCPSKPNGPFLGTCLPPSAGGLCRSNRDCPPGVTCSQSQEFVGICQSGSFNVFCSTDADCGSGVSCGLRQSEGEPVGAACPEPGLAVGLAMGIALLAWPRRRLASYSAVDHVVGRSKSLATVPPRQASRSPAETPANARRPRAASSA